MKFEIRQIGQDDLENLVALVREFAAFENLSEYCEITVERLDTAIFGDGAVTEGLIALDGTTAIGYALFFPNFSSFRGQRGIYLDDIYVTADYRGKGVGEEMLRHIACLAKERGFERLDFLVLQQNTPAIDFYKKLGAVSNADERHFKFADDVFDRLAEPPV